MLNALKIRGENSDVLENYDRATSRKGATLKI